ncbi:MAG TPA: nucleotidyltransferase domain-containing protein [Patescibacteria group bacterium]|nr:nucleotidyltransferase domain-containing protein [Patescibacteria group bacterium]
MGKINIEKIKPDIEKLAQKFHLSLVVLFGSQASGKTHAKSDFDLAVLTDHKFSREEYAKIISDFSQALKIPSKRIDVTELFHANPLLTRRIFFGGKLLCGDMSVFKRRKMIALKQAMDHKKFFVLKDDYIHQKLYGSS